MSHMLGLPYVCTLAGNSGILQVMKRQIERKAEGAPKPCLSAQFVQFRRANGRRAMLCLRRCLESNLQGRGGLLACTVEIPRPATGHSNNGRYCWSLRLLEMTPRK